VKAGGSVAASAAVSVSASASVSEAEAETETEIGSKDCPCAIAHFNDGLQPQASRRRLGA
jgi:hypothetical protein